MTRKREKKKEALRGTSTFSKSQYNHMMLGLKNKKKAHIQFKKSNKKRN